MDQVTKIQKEQNYQIFKPYIQINFCSTYIGFTEPI